MPSPASPGSAPIADDIALDLSSLSAFAIGNLLSAMDASQPLDSAFRQMTPYSGEREPGEHVLGARQGSAQSPRGYAFVSSPARGGRT